MELKDVITNVAAVVGMALGIYNYIHARAAERVRLRVIPKASVLKGMDDNDRPFYVNSKDHFNLDCPTASHVTLSIEVVNLSKFAVTVDEVGLRPRWRKNRLALSYPILMDGKPWPRKLEPRESVTASFDVAELIKSPHLPAVTHAYATTVCDKTCYGRSGALREFIRAVKKSIRPIAGTNDHRQASTWLNARYRNNTTKSGR